MTFPLPTNSGSHTPSMLQPHPPSVRWLSRGGEVGSRRASAARPMAPCRSRTRRRYSTRAMPAPMLRDTQRLG
uniref:Uncharacterized protein n=1 Tax=Oryza sativa subsp. japonica TaxID=39947 RepID=Q69K91_ORYSJ|nr:hypothetical protein [Oryza sativa Japonica Group]